MWELFVRWWISVHGAGRGFCGASGGNESFGHSCVCVSSQLNANLGEARYRRGAQRADQGMGKSHLDS